MPGSGLPDLAALATSVQASDPSRCRELLDLLSRGLRALDPEAAVARTLQREVPSGRHLTVAALGKSSPAMARGAATALGDRVERWLVVSDHEEPVPAGTELMISSHPVPDESSVAAGRRLLEVAREPADQVILLVSGGGSALAEVPLPGVSLTDLATVYDLLMREGVPIKDANVVRSHLSTLKGGKLAAAVIAPLTTIVLSDVGPRLDMVASGPSVPASSKPRDALDVLDQFGLTRLVPQAVRDALVTDEPPAPPPPSRVIAAGDGATAAAAVVGAGRDRGIPVSILTTTLHGEAAEAARWSLRSVPPGEAAVLAGETTVTVRGSGRGGRNQEAALAAAVTMDGEGGVFVALGTDGIDGPTDACGAYVDGGTAGRIRDAGIDPQVSLTDNDSHTALDGAGALLRTGPTGINVADLWLVDRR